MGRESVEGTATLLAALPGRSSARRGTLARSQAMRRSEGTPADRETQGRAGSQGLRTVGSLFPSEALVLASLSHGQRAALAHLGPDTPSSAAGPASGHQHEPGVPPRRRVPVACQAWGGQWAPGRGPEGRRGRRGAVDQVAPTVLSELKASTSGGDRCPAAGPAAPAPGTQPGSGHTEERPSEGLRARRKQTEREGCAWGHAGKPRGRGRTARHGSAREQSALKGKTTDGLSPGTARPVPTSVFQVVSHRK